MMKFRAIAAIALAVLCLASCKKDEEKEYMDGSLLISGILPTYVAPGGTYTFSASGVTVPDGTKVGYYFKNPFTSVLDTTDVYSFTVQDEPGSYNLTCVAFPAESSDKYYSTSTYRTFTVVTESSLQGIPEYAGGGTVSIGSRSYPTFQACGLEWLGSNLSLVPDGSSGHPYAGCPAMLEPLGAFYTWEEASDICPSGWRLPTDSEWVELIKLAGGPEGLQPHADSPAGAGNLMVKCTFNGSNLWEYYRGVNILNATHFSAIPAGYATISSGSDSFTGFGSYAAFWTADEQDGMGVYRYIYQEYDNVYAGLGDKDSFGASVRCVR
ncbi:MAG: fibrobacter succinogenes major paralogous domain-containing protein [Bacteroidales bacterium]|nr:fibrobacter succinogenes major paralogous domain-containing protein [Bacteroidales bacterium]